MPLLFPLLGLFGITAAVFGGERLAANIPAPQTPSVTNAGPSIPWYVPVVIIGVGGLLLYKEGAKILKL